jgi:hypothetical protein
MTPVQLCERMLDARRRWIDLPSGQAVRIVRPAEADMPRYRRGVTLELLGECVDDWRGFTEADLLGPTVGTDSAVPFDADVWRAYVADHVDLVAPVAKAVAESIKQHLEAKASTAKN